MKKNILLGLIIAILFQLVVLISMVGLAALPLWTGTEVKIKTIPIDPRSLFRGNYARLRYEISQLEIHTDKVIRNGEIVYVLLNQADDGIYIFSATRLDKPDSGIFLRGRINNKRYSEKGHVFDINYGIEAFFAPKQKALALEDKLSDGGIAVLMVSKSGKARLKDVIDNN